MDTLSFALGIATVVVTAVAVVAVYAFVKVRELGKGVERQAEATRERFKDESQYVNMIQQSIGNEIETVQRDIHSYVDSRLDKLENRLNSSK